MQKYIIEIKMENISYFKMEGQRYSMLNKNIRKLISSGLIIKSMLATTILNGCDTKKVSNKINFR